jgi:hypothetical protein
MGKADIYVLMLIVGIAAVLAAGWGIVRLIRRLSAKAHAHHVAKLEATTPWTEFTDVADDGTCVIGVHRAAENREWRRVVLVQGTGGGNRAGHRTEGQRGS